MCFLCSHVFDLSYHMDHKKKTVQVCPHASGKLAGGKLNWKKRTRKGGLAKHAT